MERTAPTTAGKWAVVPHGCVVPAAKDKISGRCVYASSPDRGLHHLLMAWPAIVAAVPGASLQIAYGTLGAWLHEHESGAPPTTPDGLEHRRRGLLVFRRLKELPAAGHAVRWGSLTHKELSGVLAEAEVYAYPCDPIGPTESFSCSTLEACAAGALPVLLEADALGSIYGDACPTAITLQAWTANVIRALTDKTWADEWRTRARGFARRHTWPRIAAVFEGVLHRALAQRGK
jgi:hypothetical protein